MNSNMKWTEEKPPTEGISWYNHITAETPIGQCIIEWKGWKEDASFTIKINDDYITETYEDLEHAKNEVDVYLKTLFYKLKMYLEL